MRRYSVLWRRRSQSSCPQQSPWWSSLCCCLIRNWWSAWSESWRLRKGWEEEVGIEERWRGAWSQGRGLHGCEEALSWRQREEHETPLQDKSFDVFLLAGSRENESLGPCIVAVLTRDWPAGIGIWAGRRGWGRVCFCKDDFDSQMGTVFVHDAKDNLPFRSQSTFSKRHEHSRQKMQDFYKFERIFKEIS